MRKMQTQLVAENIRFGAREKGRGLCVMEERGRPKGRRLFPSRNDYTLNHGVLCCAGLCVCVCVAVVFS